MKFKTIFLFLTLALFSQCGSSVDVSSLPEISTFLTTPSQQFLVDMEFVTRTSPFIGSNGASPHDGAHVHFSNAGEIPTGSEVTAYPPIYAIADGTVVSVETYFAVGENYKYNIKIAFAQDNGKEVDFDYSIEPMTNPGQEDFYEAFIMVTEGQTVTSGDIIAYMFLEENLDGPHIHFAIEHEEKNKQAPAIFSTEIMDEFISKLVEEEDCIGRDLTADENPFGSATSCL